MIRNLITAKAIKKLIALINNDFNNTIKITSEFYSLFSGLLSEIVSFFEISAIAATELNIPEIS